MEHSCTIVRRNLNIPETHCQILDDSYKITKPTIICLGGNATLTNKDSNAMCKIAERLIGLKQPSIAKETATNEDIDIIGITYAPMLNKYGKKMQTSQLVHNDVEALTLQLLCPLVIKDDKKLAIDQACKNITNVTFLSHSLGTRESAKLIHYLAGEMLAVGYTQLEADKILSNITSISFGPHTTISEFNLEVFGSSFPNVQQFNIKSLRDNFDMEYTLCTNKDATQLNGLDFVRSSLSDNEYDLYASRFTPSSADDHMIGRVLFRDENWNCISWNTNKQGEHWYVGQNADAISQCAGYILSTSLVNAMQNNNSGTFIPKPSTEAIISDCKDIVSQFENICEQ